VIVEFHDDAVDTVQVGGLAWWLIRTRSPTFNVASAFCELIIRSSSWLAWAAAAIAARWASSSPAAIWSNSSRSGSGSLDRGSRAGWGGGS